ncbi:pyridoxal 5'-phosphate synthase [Saccharomonospora sp. NPDC006951]
MSTLRGWPSFPPDLPDFDVDAAPGQPVDLFLSWLSDAGETGLAPHAMTLSTVDENGLPDARVLILKDVDETGWYFATSAESPKGRQLARNGHAALTFFWPHRGRQVRIRGTARPLGEDAGASDFLARPDASKVETAVGHQSEVLADPSDLTTAVEAAQRLIAEKPGFVPPSWMRYLLAADLVEFWQARHDRKHVRLRFTREGMRWRRDQLWP